MKENWCGVWPIKPPNSSCIFCFYSKMRQATSLESTPHSTCNRSISSDDTRSHGDEDSQASSDYSNSDDEDSFMDHHSGKSLVSYIGCRQTTRAKLIVKNTKSRSQVWIKTYISHFKLYANFWLKCTEVEQNCLLISPLGTMLSVRVSIMYECVAQQIECSKYTNKQSTIFSTEKQ